MPVRDQMKLLLGVSVAILLGTGSAFCQAPLPEVNHLKGLEVRISAVNPTTVEFEPIRIRVTVKNKRTHNVVAPAYESSEKGRQILRVSGHVWWLTIKIEIAQN